MRATGHGVLGRKCVTKTHLGFDSCRLADQRRQAVRDSHTGSPRLDQSATTRLQSGSSVSAAPRPAAPVENSGPRRGVLELAGP